MSEEREAPRADMESVAEILRRHVETERAYASYWKFSLDRQVEEQHVAACLIPYLEAFEGWAGATVAISEDDPPDCYGVAAGKKFGIEVTELVHEKTVAAHQLRRNAERKGLLPPPKAADAWDTAQWTARALRAALTAIVEQKDKPAIGGPFSPYLVAIFTDELTVTPELVTEAMAGVTITSRHIDDAYLLLSYDPRAEESPNRIPVYKIPVSKEP